MLDISGIVRIFEEIERRLISSLKRNLSRHKREEREYEKNWSAWQAEKLRSLERFRRENAEIMAEYTEQIDDETRAILEGQFAEGVNGVDAPPAEAVPDAPAEVVSEPQFFGVDRTKVDRLIEDITHMEQQAETAALRMTDDVYRQTLNRVQLAMSTGSMSLQQAIDLAVEDFLNAGINCIEYKDGRRVNIADYVRMALRSTSTRAALQGKSERYKALGYDTVAVSSYGMCSPTCLPYQGRVYINDAFTSWTGETEPREDGLTWGRSNYCGKWFPLLSSAISKGLFHPNCRHSITLWRDGDKLPSQVDNSETERRYKLQQQQRALERAVRKAKRRVEGFTDPENISKAQAELKEAQKKLREFIGQTNADEGATVLKRDQGREKVYSSEGVDNSAESGIMIIRGEGMYRKSDPSKIEPMPKKQFRRIEKSFRAKGGIIQYGEETDAYLATKNAEAITYNAHTILLKQNPGRASVFEELIHATQYKNGENDGSYSCRLRCEIEAQKKLLKYSKVYKLTQNEIIQTQKALEAYEKELEEYIKNGGV